VFALRIGTVKNSKNFFLVDGPARSMRNGTGKDWAATTASSEFDICRSVLKSFLTQLWCNPDCFNSADFHVGAHVVMKRWPGSLPRARHTTPMISLDHLVRRAHRGASLEETLGEDSPLAIQIAANNSDRGAA
jgi:hypothetical protein